MLAGPPAGSGSQPLGAAARSIYLLRRLRGAGSLAATSGTPLSRVPGWAWASVPQTPSLVQSSGTDDYQQGAKLPACIHAREAITRRLAAHPFDPSVRPVCEGYRQRVRGVRGRRCRVQAELALHHYRELRLSL